MALEDYLDEINELMKERSLLDRADALLEFAAIASKLKWYQGEVMVPRCPPVIDNPQPRECTKNLSGKTADQIEVLFRDWIDAAKGRWISGPDEPNG